MKRKTLISRAALSRALRCSRSTISQMVDRGLPCEDGQLDRTAALQWIVASTSGSAGGGDADHGRVSLRERALAILAGPAPAVQPVQSAPQADHGDDWRRVAVDILQRIAVPQRS